MILIKSVAIYLFLEISIESVNNYIINPIFIDIGFNKE